MYIVKPEGDFTPLGGTADYATWKQWLLFFVLGFFPPVFVFIEAPHISHEYIIVYLL